MDLSRIPVGENPPHEVNVIIEIPQGGAPVKYEVDKVSGAMFVDRFLHTAMFYPANYGFIPHTLSEDGDPIDCMVIAPTPVATGAVVRARPIGALLMEDEKGVDEKIIAVPVDKLHPFYKRVASYRDLPEILVEQIGHFFEHYKDLEKGKWVKVVRWVEPPEAIDLIRAGIERARGLELPSRDFPKTNPVVWTGFDVLGHRRDWSVAAMPIMRIGAIEPVGGAIEHLLTKPTPNPGARMNALKAKRAFWALSR